MPARGCRRSHCTRFATERLLVRFHAPSLCRSDQRIDIFIPWRYIPHLRQRRYRLSPSSCLQMRLTLTIEPRQVLLLAEQPELRRQMGRAGCQIAGEKFALKRNVAQLIRAYDLR